MTIDRHLFLSLLRSGLWERPVQLPSLENQDLDSVFQLADEQSVVGLVAAGLELVEGRKVTKKQALPFLKKVFALEGRNAEMNLFISDLFARLREKGIHAILVKGQGIAQCYERPQWRAAGDVDLLLDAENYEKAKSFLIPLASHVEKEYKDRLHLGMKSILGRWNCTAPCGIIGLDGRMLILTKRKKILFSMNTFVFG